MSFNRKSTAQAGQLSAYIIANTPSGLDFSNAEDPPLAVAMNSSSTDTVDRTSVTARDMLTATDGTEYASLAAARQRAWGVIMAVAAEGGIDPNDPSVVSQIQAVWDAGATRTALLALQTKEATHAESLFGDGTRLVHLDIAAARSA